MSRYSYNLQCMQSFHDEYLYRGPHQHLTKSNLAGQEFITCIGITPGQALSLFSNNFVSRSLAPVAKPSVTAGGYSTTTQHCQGIARGEPASGADVDSAMLFALAHQSAHHSGKDWHLTTECTHNIEYTQCPISALPVPYQCPIQCPLVITTVPYTF